MGFEGLSGFRAQQEAHKVQQDDTFYKLKEKNGKALIRPLVELDPTSINYVEGRLPLYTQEFQNPQKFWLSVIDTRDDGEGSFGWDMVNKFGWFKQKDPDLSKGQHSDKKFNWNPLQYVYLPVLVKDTPDGDERVEVMRLKYRGGEMTAFIEFAGADRVLDEDGNSSDPYASITDRWWTYTRNGGEGWDIRYNAVPRDPSDDVKVTDYDYPDLEQFVNRVPYAEQEAFLQVATNPVKERDDATAAAPQQQMESAVQSAKW